MMRKTKLAVSFFSKKDQLEHWEDAEDQIESTP